MTVRVKRLLLFVILCILIYQDSLVELVGFSTINYLDEIFILSFFIMTLVKNQLKIKKDAGRLFVRIGIYFLCGITFCLVFSDYSSTNLLMSGFLSIKFFLVVFSAWLYPFKERTIREFMLCIKRIGWLSFFAGAINFVIPSLWTSIIPYTWIDYRLGMPSAMGLFTHPGQFGWFMLFVGLFHYVTYKRDNNVKALIHFVEFALMAVLSFKAKVIVGVIVVILVELFIIEKRRINLEKIVVPFAGILGIGIIFGRYIVENIQKYIFGTTVEISARYVLLNRSLQILKDYFPFGVGFGKFGSWYARINYSEYYYLYDCTNVYGLHPSDPKFATDTFWPSVMGETGLVGLLLFIESLIYILRKQFDILRSKSIDNDNRSFVLLGILVMVQALVESMAEPIFSSSPQNIFIALIVGAGLSVGTRTLHNTRI